MKPLVLLTITLTALNCESCKYFSNKKDLPPWPVFSPIEMSYDFGKITGKEKLPHVFKFTNTGVKDLLISSTIASCGCTAVVHFPKEPIPPDGEGQIDIEFDPTGISGMVNQYVEIGSNANPGLCKLTFTAEVLP